MEPPAKRMRILQSVEVDEENLDYIKMKQMNQEKLKNRWESIFDKYANMNESQTDEIDMDTNTVVVDRGHLRRLKRQIHSKGTTLLDTLVLAAGRDSEDDAEEEGDEEDSEDELAPPQLIKSKAIGPPEQEMSKQQTRATNISAQHIALPQSNMLAPSIPQFSVPQIPHTPNPIANLVPYLHFPRTPAGQEEEDAFIAKLAQALAPLINGQQPPNAQTPFANAAPVPITPITTNDKVPPPTDPKWFFPPLPSKSRQPPIAQSSPLPSYTVAPIVKESVQQHEDARLTDLSEERSVMALCGRPDERSPARPHRSSPRVEIPRRNPWTARKYPFTYEDDVYISKRRRIDGVSWAAIKASRQKWKQWPMTALHNRWILINNQNLHLQEPPVVPMGGRVSGSGCVSREKVHASPKPSHHLPTPSSSEQEECHQGLTMSTEESVQHMPSSSAYFDDDDRDLLSLAGTDSDEEQLPTGDYDIIEPISEDVVLPSVEMRDLVDKKTMQEDLSVNLPTQDDTTTPPRATSSITVKTEPTFSSPLALRKRNQPSIIAELLPNSQENEGNMQDDLSNSISVPLPCSTDNTSSKIPNTTSGHQIAQPSTHSTSLRRSQSLDLIDTSADELLTSPLTPTTPCLKRRHESSTPRTALPSASYQTPKVRCIDGSSDNGTKSTSRANRKAFHKRIKKEWTRKGTPMKESVGKKRNNLGALEMRKRKWVGDEDGSEDELAL